VRIARVLLLTSLTLGCGLQVVGAGDPDGGTGMPLDPDASASADAPINEPTDAPSPPPECACALTPPAGFTVVALAGDRSAGCGDGLVAIDLVTDPVAAAAACTCGSCAVTATPSCNTGSFSNFYDEGGGACGSVSANVRPANTGCNTDDGFFVSHARAGVPPPSGPTACTAPVTPHANEVTSKPIRVCAPKPGADDCVCKAAAPYRKCLRAPGDVSCPASAPNKKLAGTRVTAVCGTCPCTATATCTGTVTFYSDNGCMNVIATINEKECKTTPDGANFSSLRWNGTAAVACNVAKAPTAAALTEPTTICCP